MTQPTYSGVLLYARFSDPTQGKGTSIQRQVEEGTEELARLGLAPTRIEKDKGKSGYHGHHRSSGKLGLIEAEVEQGELHGWLFYCEKIDRLSREGRDPGMDLIKKLITHGVSVRTKDGDFFPAGQPITLEQDITVRVRFDLARKESEGKAQRTSSNWHIKAEKARREGVVMSRLTKAWCRVGANGRLEAKPGAAELLMRIFTLVDEKAEGSLKIARTLNDEGVEPWATWEKEDGTKRQPKAWRRQYIASLLSDRAVTGEFQPRKTVGGQLVPDGDPIPDYFPQIVPMDLFERVSSEAARRARKEHSGGRNSGEHVPNLFGGLVRCAECGNALIYKRWNKAGRNSRGESYRRDQGSLVCQTAYEGGCSNRKYLAYLTFEEAVLNLVLHVAMDDAAFSRKDEVARLNVTVAERSRAVELAKAKAEKLWEAWAESESDMRKRLAEKAETDAAALAENLVALQEQLARARGSASSAEHLARVADVRRNLYCEDLAQRAALRNKVAVALKQVLSGITIDHDMNARIEVARGLMVYHIDRKGRLFNADPCVDRAVHALDEYRRIRGIEGNGHAVDEVVRRTGDREIKAVAEAARARVGAGKPARATILAETLRRLPRVP
ncbi:MAG TPA: recombinase family protein [Allosphingosinicella sp.]